MEAAGQELEAAGPACGQAEAAGQEMEAAGPAGGQA